MIVTTPARLEPAAVPWLFESASAAVAIPRLGRVNASAASSESGWKTFCGFIAASTSCCRALLHWSRRRCSGKPETRIRV